MATTNLKLFLVRSTSAFNIFGRQFISILKISSCVAAAEFRQQFFTKIIVKCGQVKMSLIFLKLQNLFNLDSTSRTIFTRHRHQSLLDLGLLVLILLEEGFCLEETLLIYAES